MNSLRVFLHAALMAVGFVPWVIAMACMAFVTWWSLLGERVLPGAKAQNCWTYALPKWQRHGGYLLIRYADGVQMWGVRFPHVEWVKTLPKDGIELEYFHPTKRRRGFVAPWSMAYYEGHVRTREVPHNAKL